MPKKQISVIFLILTMLLFLTACTSGTNNNGEKSEEESQPSVMGPSLPNITDPDITELESSGSVVAFPIFSTQTMEGKEISNAVFADATLTMINIWATYCPPCIEEMPDLGKMAENMPEGSQLLGLVVDYHGNEDLAAQILSESKATFPQLIPEAGLMEYLMNVTAIPTTIFVDAQGNLVGDQVVGKRTEAQYRSEIEQRLAAMGS